MKIVFFGSSEFAVTILEGLRVKEDVVLSITQPDRKKGRALRIGTTPVKLAADRLSIKTFQPDTVNQNTSIEYLKKFNADIFVVVSFGEILKEEVLNIPKLYSINVHASLLPKYRGAAPINWAIANGEKETGVTIIKMNERMDEGEIMLQEKVSIEFTDDTITLSRKLSRKGNEALLNCIDSIRKDRASFKKQPDAGVTYAPKLKKQDGLIDWNLSAEEIYNRIRAFVPWPGCFTYWDKKILKIWKANVETVVAPATPKLGTVLDVDTSAIRVSTGRGILKIEELQLEARRRMTAKEFIAGHKELVVGAQFISRLLS